MLKPLKKLSRLQKRIQKRKPSPKLQAQVPVRILFYDVLELEGKDCRHQPLSTRRAALEQLLEGVGEDAPQLNISPVLAFENWQELTRLRQQSAEQQAEGLMLKARASIYQEGRKRGDWWKWKVDPFTVDAVLIYAHSGSGRRSTLHTDYTFALIMIGSDTNKTLPVGLASMVGSFDLRWGEIMAGSTLIALPLFAAFALMSQYFIQGLGAGAVKG